MKLELTAAEAVERINSAAANLWMVRTFLKHAEEMEDDPERMEVPRQIFDFVRTLEPRRAAGDVAGFLRQARRKLHRLRKVSDWFSAEVRNISAHTNFEQAAVSLAGCVRSIQEILAAVPEDGAAGMTPEPDVSESEPDPLDSL